MEMGYYTNQLDTYNNNYNDAIRKVDNIKSQLQKLYDSFNGSSGNSIDNIRYDLKALIDNLTSIRKTIVDGQCKSNDNASSCERCYYYWYNSSGYIDVGIDKEDGLVYGTEVIPDDHEYHDATFLESLLGISSARAEGITQYVDRKATVTEMLTKY